MCIPPKVPVRGPLIRSSPLVSPRRTPRYAWGIEVPERLMHVTPPAKRLLPSPRSIVEVPPPRTLVAGIKGLKMAPWRQASKIRKARHNGMRIAATFVP